MDSRVKRLGIETTGQVVAGTGAAIAVLGSVVPGIGNAIGAGTAAAGTGLGLLPRAYAGVRAVYKNISDTKGVDRGAGAELLWGLAISKGIRDRKIVETSLEGPAKTAYDKATQGATSDDLKNGERLASEFLEITGIYDPKLNGEGNTLKADDLLLKSAGYQKIFDAMRSTTDAK